MKLYKKSQSPGWHIIVLAIILLAAAVIFAIMMWQSKGIMADYIDRIFS